MSEIDKLLATEKIRTQLYLYCKGIDRRDWSLVRSCFGDDHQHRHGGFEGSADEFVGFASTVLKSVAVSHHSLANIIVNLDDDLQGARTEANFTAVHYIQAGITEGLAIDTRGLATDWIVAGSYRDRWAYRDDQWLIVERDASHQWERLEPSTDRNE